MSHCCALYKMKPSPASSMPDIDWLNGDYQYTEYYNADTATPSTFYVCYEADSALFVANDEYAPAQVNYCPFCGYKAFKQIVPLLEAQSLPQREQ